MPSGGGGTQTVQQNPNPWEGAQPYLTGGLHQLNEIFRHGQPDQSGPASAGGLNVPSYYPGSTVAPMSPWTTGALTAQAQRAASGSPVIGAAQSTVQSLGGGEDYWNTIQNFQGADRNQAAVLRGDFLNAGNPYLQGAISAATRPMIENYSTNIAPGLDSAFSSAGRYGSGAHATAQGQAADALTRGIGDVSSNMAFGNYSAERGFQQQAAAQAAQNFDQARARQLQGAALAPQLAMQDYVDINQLGASGSALDAYNQALTDADIQRYNYGQDADWRRAQEFLATVQGAAPFGSSTSSQQPRPNPFTSALGGAGTGAALGSMFGPWGTGIGAALGGLGGMFSDERLKTDIEPVGMLHNGLPVYSYRYVWGGPTQIGVMAQDALEVEPEAVGMRDGYLTVDYDRVA